MTGIYRQFMKRTIDVTLASLMLVVLSPLLLLTAFLIWIESGSPVLFKQKRGGRNGKYFRILKFRSMSVDKDAEKKGFEPGSLKRITRVGKIMRKTKIDELPQLLNIIRGEMSLVGPRPEVRKYIELYPKRWARVLSVLPGITDPASIEFRNEEEILAASPNPEKEYRNVLLPKKLDIYENYIRNVSFTCDFKILLKTFFAVIFK